MASTNNMNHSSNIQKIQISKEGGIQTALKLLNQYAESYYLLEDQYETLKKENKDLRSNLNINKEIIKSFIQNSPSEQKYNNYISKMKEENQLYIKKIEKLELELNNYKSKKNYDFVYKDKYEQCNTKIFLLENLLIEKDNEIKKYKNLSASKKNHSSIVNELYIADPSKVANKLNDELEIYRKLIQKANEHIKSFKAALKKKDTRLKEYENKIQKFTNELSQYKQDKTNSTIIYQLNQYKQANNLSTISSNYTSCNTLGNNLNPKTTNSRSNSYNFNECLSTHTSHTNQTNMSLMSKSKRNLITQIEKLEQINSNKKKINDKDFDLTQEWYEALKHCNMTQEEFIKSCMNPRLVKLTDIIEYLYKIIIDKNIQLKLIIEENDYLNLDNLKLNKNIIELTEQIDNMKFENSYKEGNNCKDGIDKCNSNTNINTISNSGGGSGKKNNQNDNSTFVNVDNSVNNISNNININVMMDYIKEVKQSITSSEFQEGMAIDQFDVVSEMSKNKNFS